MKAFKLDYTKFKTNSVSQKTEEKAVVNTLIGER